MNLSHLLNYKDKLSKRNKAETGIRYEWYALQRCAASYYEEFEKEKIVYQEMVQESSFVYDIINKYYCLDTGRIITGKDIKYLLTILNSKLFFFAVKYYYGGGSLGSTGIRMKHTFFEKYPAPKISHKEPDPFIELVDKIIAKKKRGENTTAEEQQIDIMVYKLYELTYDEVKIIDPEFALTEEEYVNYG